MTKQVEVITSLQRRRRWTSAEKERIVAARLVRCFSRLRLLRELVIGVSRTNHGGFGFPICCFFRDRTHFFLREGANDLDG